MARQGKYAEIVKTLPRLPEDADYQQKVNAVKELLLQGELEMPDGMGYPSSGMIAHAYREARDKKDDLEDELKATQLKLTALEQLLDDRYENDGIKSCVLDDGSTVGIQLEPHASVVDRNANRAWAVANGYESQLSLPWQTINAITKQHRLDGQPDPDGVSVFSKTKVVLRRG